MKSVFFSTAVAMLLGTSVATVPYSEYILAPESRTIYPTEIHQINGTVANAASLLNGPTGNATLYGNSTITFDYGQNVGGVVSVTVGASSSDSSVGLTFTESSLWISSLGSDATSGGLPDEVMWLLVGQGPGTYTLDRSHDRGAFRYLSLIGNSSTSVQMTAVTTNYTAAPEQDLRAYTGFFHCNDELLNRIWYAGAYTNQMCTIDPAFGSPLSAGSAATPSDVTAVWFSNYTVTNGTTCNIDGAKRDGIVWPGDMSIATPSIFVSTNDMLSLKNSLDALLVLQASNGMLPYAGAPFAFLNYISFTYHLYTLIGISSYYQYTGNVTYLQEAWPHFLKGLSWSVDSIDSSGLMNVTASNDWLRVGMSGHNIEANAILYYTINQGLNLAAVLNDSTVTANWTRYAENIKTAANTLLWNATTGLYHDNETTLLAPQDGNAWAVKANLTLDAAQASVISSSLRARWGPYGAPAPEAGPTLTISPFIGGFELETHFLSSAPQTAIDLMRLQWGNFMLDDPRMTNSTFIEGYSADGSLHYAPYASDLRVSHAHGWSTGPTSLLSFYVAGIHLTSAQGTTWIIKPAMADLTSVHAGFQTGLGAFENEVKTTGVNGSISEMTFTAPNGTMGSVILSGVEGYLQRSDGTQVQLVDGVAESASGGSWTLVVGQ